MLRKRWEPLTKGTIGNIPEAYGYYELGDIAEQSSAGHQTQSGNTDVELVGRGVGVLKDEVKEAFAYGDATRVRWERATSLDHAERIAAEHDPST